MGLEVERGMGRRRGEEGKEEGQSKEMAVALFLLARRSVLTCYSRTTHCPRGLAPGLFMTRG